jgi:uncharacterized protein (TIGR02646 family)
MKYIYVQLTDIDQAWEMQAELARTEAAAKASPEDCQAYIGSKSKIWRDCKPLLEKLSKGKCWYTEARDKVSYLEVDHYRPKKLYPWLAFDWNNFRLCGGKPNRKKTDEFPLEDESVRASNANADLGLERPLLLDPLSWGDAELLTFKADGEPTCARPSDAVAVERVRASVAATELDSSILCEERREKWRKCERKLKKLRDMVAKNLQRRNVSAAEFSIELCRDLVDLFDDDAEFTSTAKACSSELQADSIVQLARFVCKTRGAQPVV